MALKDEGIEKVISDQIRELIGIKADIANAVNEIGGSISRTDTFASYADRIRDLDPKKNLDLTTLNVSANGTYTADSEGCDGFTSVTVNVSDYGSGGSGGSGGGSIGGDDGVIDDPAEATYTVTFVNEHDPNWENIEVQVSYMQSASVPNGTVVAWYDNNGNKQDRYKFKKWNPIPDKVTTDMTVVAEFMDLESEIEDDWETIAQNGGVDYEIGQFKTLWVGPLTYHKQKTSSNRIQSYQEQKNKNVYGIMVKVEDGDGVNSTWVSKTLFGTNLSLGSGSFTYVYGHFVEFPVGTDISDGSVIGSSGNDVLKWGFSDSYKKSHSPVYWNNSDLRKWLNNDFLKAIDFRQYIKKVKKKAYNGTTLNSVPTTEDQIWIPSLSELFGPSSDYNDGDVVYGEHASTKSVKQFGGILRMVRTVDKNDPYRVLSAGPSRSDVDTIPSCESQPLQIGFCL